VINKIVDSVAEAVRGIGDGATILISGFGTAGTPDKLIEGLNETKATDLTIICNNAGTGTVGLADILQQKRVRKIICSFPRQAGSLAFNELYRSGQIELELVPQGTLAERIRAAGAGIGGFYTRTAAGTPLAQGKEVRVINGEEYVFETPLHADFALVKAYLADRWGNLVYRKTGRNFGPIMATAGKTTIVEVEDTVDLGALDPETIVTPGVFVDRVVKVGRYTPHM
jgi:3-oxoadipate CoA-transferase alpha subunit